MAVSKPNRNRLWRLGSASSSFEAQQKQFVGPREVPWQSCWEGLRVLRLLRGAENVPDGSFEAHKKQVVAPRKCQ